MSFLIRGGRFIDPLNGTDDYRDITVEDYGADELYDASGLIVTRGLVDMHCHLREPGQEHKGDIASESLAALHGGFTAIVCMPNTSPAVDNPELVRYIREQDTPIHVYPTGAVTVGIKGKELADHAEMKKAGAVAITDDGMPVVSDKVLRKALHAELPLIYHSEDFNRPDEDSEWVDVERAVRIAEEENEAIHITHISSVKTVDIIRKAKKRGVRVTCDTCPHYFSLTSEALGRIGANAKMNPPLKTFIDVEAIIEGLKDGTIDAISTDHAPHTLQEKMSENPPNGIVGFETALALGITKLVKLKHLTINELISKMSGNPTRILNLENHGDFVIIDPNIEWEVRDLKSKSKNSPFIGEKLTGKAVAAIVSDSAKGKAKLYYL